jgi:hypothetical protein
VDRRLARRTRQWRGEPDRDRDFPRIETAKSWITMGFDQDLNKAWAQTKAQTVKFLVEQRKVSDG